MWLQLYTQTVRLFRFILRQDRISLPIWLLAITLITVVVASAFVGLYPTENERQAIAETMQNPAMIAMVGIGYGLEDYTIGAMMAHQMLLFTAIAVAIMSILIVTKHTRTNEEEGRIELIRSLPVGKLSSLSATLGVIIVANLMLTLLIAGGLYVLQIESIDFQGSLLYGAALGATGIFFAGITALFAQISESSRGTIGFSFAALGVAYVIRAIGDVSNESLSWISPLGWILGTEVFVNNYWGPIFLTLGVSIILMSIALYLNAMRDLGSGLLSSKPGRRSASKLLLSPFGLASRLQRTSIISWALGMFLIGVSYGSVFGDLDAFFTSNEALMEMIGHLEGYTLTEQFITMLMAVMAMIGTIPALMMVLKLKGEENKQRVEHILARAISRTKLIGSYIVLATLISIAMLFLGLFGLWSASTAVMEEAIAFGTMFAAGMIYLPALWLMIGIAVLLIGLRPQLTGLIWLYLGYSFFVVYLGGLLQFPDWLAKLSPFGHVPQYPVEEISLFSLILLTVAAVLLVYIGIKGYTNRDIQG